MIDTPKATGTPAESPSILLLSSAAVLKNARLGHPQYGAATIATERLNSPTVIAWPLETSAGPGHYEVWLRYAASGRRSVALSINGRPVFTYAAYESTGGWTEPYQVWRFQGAIEAAENITTVEIKCDGPIPHLTAIALVPIISPGKQIGVDQGFKEQQILEQGRALCDSEEFALAKNCFPEIDRLTRAGVGSSDLVRALTGLVGAAHDDSLYPQRRFGFSGPFNGQERRHELLWRLDQRIGFFHLLETGAYRGTSTEFLARMGRPVFSCEKIDSNFYFALARLSGFNNVRLHRQDSRLFLKAYFKEFPSPIAPLFAYLDAHWEADLPLPEEIDLISNNAERFVLMVDDFKNPFHAYSFDRYPSGSELTLEYVLPRLKTTRDLAYYFFNFPPAMETGVRRGTLIVATPDLALKHLDHDRYLQRYIDPGE